MLYVKDDKQIKVSCYMCKSENVKLGKTIGNWLDCGVVTNWEFEIVCTDCGFSEKWSIDPRNEDIIS